MQRGIEAAERRLVADLPAPELLGHVDDRHGTVVTDEGGDARRVRRARGDRLEIGVLHDALFDEHLALRQQLGVERRPVGDVGRVVAAHAGARFADRHLGDEHRMPLREALKLTGVARLEREPLATEKAVEVAVEVDLVVEPVHLRRIVVPVGEFESERARHPRGALGAREDREVELDVVVEPDAVAGSRPQHVGEHQRIALAVRVSGGARALRHRRVVESARAFEQHTDPMQGRQTARSHDEILRRTGGELRQSTRPSMPTGGGRCASRSARVGETRGLVVPRRGDRAQLLFVLAAVVGAEEQFAAVDLGGDVGLRSAGVASVGRGQAVLEDGGLGGRGHAHFGSSSRHVGGAVS